jgi:hypothetical protein
MANELDTLKAKLEQTEKDLAKALNLIEEGKKDKSSKELRINPPSSFSGKRSEFPAFVDDYRIYLKTNGEHYDNDDKKIAFVLSFFDKGEAAQWKNSFIADKTNNDGEIEFRTWKEFRDHLEEDFREVDEKGEALYQLQHLQQGSRTAEDLASEFKILAHKAKLLKPPNPETDPNDPGNMLLQAYFKAALQQGLHRRILEGESPPKTLDTLISRAIQLDNQWRRTNRDMEMYRPRKNLRRTYAREDLREEGSPSLTIGKLTAQEREELRKAGKCYYCQERGHRVFDCPKAPKKPPSDRKEGAKTDKKFKWNSQEAVKHVRKMGSNLPEEDIETFGQIIEKSFQEED